MEAAMIRLRARILMGAAPVAMALTLGGAAQAQSVPMDATGGCPISPSTVAGMFQSGSVSLNGVVKAADSTVVLAPNCGFFQWSEQMFLWMTSPAPPSYGGVGRIMFSSKFFTVTPLDSNGRRQFIPNNPALPMQMQLRKTELGPHGLPALMSRTGHVVEILPNKPGQTPPPMVRLSTGALVQLGSLQRAPSGALRLFDLKGAEVRTAPSTLKLIVHPMIEIAPGEKVAMVPQAAFVSAIQAHKFIINKIPIIIDLLGNVVDVEPNQAVTDGVLLSQNGSLIYYITVANDVFAYHRTMQIPGIIPQTTSITFPMTMADANAVKAFAATKGHVILEPQALAVESKSSWIDATAVPNPGDYIQTMAVVPTFNKSNPNNWVVNGQKTIKVVMVGIHVVGGTNNHGEMVWGTFEHLGNTPNALYTYNSTSGLKTVGQSTSGTWLFTPTGSTGPWNAQNNTWTGSGITGTPVGPSTVLRTKPWGMDGTNNGMNTQVIQANSSIISQLIAGDVRRNYFQLGTTWTINGAAPTGGDEVGTNQLANTTMETFMQAQTPSGSGSNCFSCHNTNKVVVSHVYPVLKPLP
jgi:hypothetical protein